MRCAKMLMHAPAHRLKAELSLSDAQIKKIESRRDNFLNKRIDMRAKIDRLRIPLRKEIQQELPNEQRVLQLMRKTRGVHGRLQEERVKTLLGTARVLTPEQRSKLRKLCRQRAGKGFEKGRGWGRMHKVRGGKGLGPVRNSES